MDETRARKLAVGMVEFGLDTTESVTGTMGQREMTIPEITINDPGRTVTAKWKLKG
jgi:hypothetical protein